MLTIFSYAEYIVEFCVKLAFLRYSQVQDRSGRSGEMYTNVGLRVNTRKTVNTAVPSLQCQQQ